MTVWVALLCLLAVIATPVFAEPPETVFLEELAWTELRASIGAGKTTIILPIGGTEQNGPHMALGKHNARVKALAERIARALGNALVAPVIAYVPEGGLNPATGHMRFPGTITVPDDVFRRVLESAARSVRLHGFRDVVFLGDHGSTQAGEKAVAARLNREWQATPVRAHAIEEYYRAATAGFGDLLKSRGYRPEELGGHAGLPDTSLTLALHPRLVRTSPRDDQEPGAGTGVEGDPRRASAELGRLGVDLIVARTVAAIRESTNRAGSSAAAAIDTVPGMPPVTDPTNLYSETRSDKLSPAVANVPARVYVPSVKSNEVHVIDPATLKVIDRFKVGTNPQHVVPSWDLTTLWVTNNAEGRTDGTLTPIDPMTGKPGKDVVVDDPYNMYFTPDGKSAVIVAEAMKRLDFRDPKTMALQASVSAPKCGGINHGDFSVDGRYLIMTCEYAGRLAKIDWRARKVLGYLTLPDRGIPQDVRVSPDGTLFYVADLRAGGVHLIDGDAFTRAGFIKTGVGAHGLYPSRDGTKLYVTNRGFSTIGGKPGVGKGSVSVIDFATRTIIATWPIPGGGSPDMGNVSVDGKQLWLSGRYDRVVYVIDTTSGEVKTIPVGHEPHGLTLWPQPGRYSLGHTGNMR